MHVLRALYRKTRNAKSKSYTQLYSVLASGVAWRRSAYSCRRGAEAGA